VKNNVLKNTYKTFSSLSGECGDSIHECESVQIQTAVFVLALATHAETVFFNLGEAAAAWWRSDVKIKEKKRSWVHCPFSMGSTR
jgi:hypothetical protein